MRRGGANHSRLSSEKAQVMALTIKHTSAPLGHELMGIDLKTIDDSTFGALDDAYREYGVIVVRGQTLSPRELVDFSARFGRLLVYPLGNYLLEGFPEIFVVSNIIENGKPIGMKEAGANWHTDMSFTNEPPRGSILYAMEVPVEDGKTLGDTLFASGAAAYDGLSTEMKARIEGLYAINSASHAAKKKMERRADADPELRARFERQAKEFPDVVHPLVRKHPLTGRKCLYLSGDQTSGIVGWDEKSSDALLDQLKAHYLSPGYIYRHTWKVGDVVFWDNCLCMHKAVQDYQLPLRRKMLRTTIGGWPTH
jgi:taurine dioxygenase